MDELQIQSVAIQNGGRCHTKLDIQLAKSIADIELPNFLAFLGITTEYSSPKKNPNVLAVSGW